MKKFDASLYLMQSLLRDISEIESTSLLRSLQNQKAPVTEATTAPKVTTAPKATIVQNNIIALSTDAVIKAFIFANARTASALFTTCKYLNSVFKNSFPLKTAEENLKNQAILQFFDATLKNNKQLTYFELCMKLVKSVVTVSRNHILKSSRMELASSDETNSIIIRSHDSHRKCLGKAEFLKLLQKKRFKNPQGVMLIDIILDSNVWEVIAGLHLKVLSLNGFTNTDGSFNCPETPYYMTFFEGLQSVRTMFITHTGQDVLLIRPPAQVEKLVVYCLESNRNEHEDTSLSEDEDTSLSEYEDTSLSEYEDTSLSEYEDTSLNEHGYTSLNKHTDTSLKFDLTLDLTLTPFLRHLEVNAHRKFRDGVRIALADDQQLGELIFNVPFSSRNYFRIDDKAFSIQDTPYKFDAFKKVYLKCALKGVCKHLKNETHWPICPEIYLKTIFCYPDGEEMKSSACKCEKCLVPNKN